MASSPTEPSPRTLERLYVYLFLVLGVAFLGVAIAIMGLASRSAAAVGVGAGTIAAAGSISIFFALARSRLSMNTPDNFLMIAIRKQCRSIILRMTATVGPPNRWQAL